MQNVLTINSINDCECLAVTAYDTRTNEIVVKITVGAAVSPRIEILSNKGGKTVSIQPNTTSQVYIDSEYWVHGDSLQFRYVDDVGTSPWFTINFPENINDIYIERDNDIVFNAKSKPVKPDYDAEIAALQASVTALQTNATALQSVVAALQASVTELTSNKSSKRWTLLGKTTQGNKIHLPKSVYDIAFEYYIVIKTSRGAVFPFYVSYNDINRDIISGYYLSASYYATVRKMSESRSDGDGWDISLNMAWCKELYNNNASTFELYVYYR